MLIPVRCFTCGSVTGDKWGPFQSNLKTMNEGEALDAMGVKRVCCRRTIMTHVDVWRRLLE